MSVTKKFLTEHIVPGKRLGRHVEHDPRSRNFGWQVEKTVVLKSVKHVRLGAWFDQGNIGSCTGNAMAGAANTRPTYYVTKHPILVEADALRCYERATVIDGFPGVYPPDDTGSSGLAVCKAAIEFGWITKYKWAFDVNTALQALMARPLIFGTAWYEGFDRPNSDGLVSISGQVRGGHEFMIRGYDATKKLLWADNSWGPYWGHAGSFCFSVDTFGQLLADQGDVKIPIR